VFYKYLDGSIEPFANSEVGIVALDVAISGMVESKTALQQITRFFLLKINIRVFEI
jgi:hypothetical protein